MSALYCQGTVFGQREKLDVMATTEQLRKAIQGIGTNKNVIIDVLSSHTNDELQEIKKMYATLYGRKVDEDLKGEILVNGDFERLCLYLLLPRKQFKAYCLNKAIKGAGTDEAILIEILCTSTNEEIHEIKKIYKEIYRNDLERDLIGDTSGDFQRVLVSLVQGNRCVDQTVDPDLVKEDVDALLEAGVKKFGTDESVFNRILCYRSKPFLEAVFAEYRNRQKIDITEDIKSEKLLGWNVKKAFLTIAKHIMNPVDYFAESFFNSMDGAGTNDERLMQLVVNHCEIDLREIAHTYMEKYKIDLSRAIYEDTSGDYRKLLVKLTAINQPLVTDPPLNLY